MKILTPDYYPTTLFIGLKQYRILFCRPMLAHLSNLRCIVPHSLERAEVYFTVRRVSLNMTLDVPII